ncbi:MAG: emrA 2 [Firmicutes bacterium]|nr:emrA 2 [Bacillota bacterium]
MFKMNRRKLVVVVAIILLAIGVAGGGWWWYRSSCYVSTDDARIDGTIVGVSAKISGRVTEVLVKDGDAVKAGQVIARLDKRDIEVQRKKAEAALAVAQANYQKVLSGSRPQEIGAAEANVNKGSAGLDDAYKNYLRVEKLYQDGAASAAQRDHAEAVYLEAKESNRADEQKLDLVTAGSRTEDINAADAMVKQAAANLDAVTVNDEDAVITSPVDGVIAMKAVNQGEVVNAGQVLFSVVDSNDVWLNARIKETEIGKVKLGQEVAYTVDGYPGRTFSGTVIEIGSATGSTFALIPAENSSGNFTKITQRIPIKISLPQADNNVVFRPGMQVIINIHVK